MHRIIFYRDRRGNSPVKDYLTELEAKEGKDARVKRTKIRDTSRRLKLTGQTSQKNIASTLTAIYGN